MGGARPKEPSPSGVRSWACLNHQKAFRCWEFQVTEFRVANEL